MSYRSPFKTNSVNTSIVVPIMAALPLTSSAYCQIKNILYFITAIVNPLEYSLILDVIQIFIYIFSGYYHLIGCSIGRFFSVMIIVFYLIQLLKTNLIELKFKY